MGVIETGGTPNAILPEQFGKYSLLGHLATGGMAEVWLARQLGLHGFEKIVVLKRARPELTDPETTRRFLDEARLVATLEHPNIAQVYEIGYVSGFYFFVMEYVDGADLRRLMEAAIVRRKRIMLADALYIIIHVSAALHYAHEKHDLEGRPLHIIHRDVSPSNVLLSHDGAIKVCDFGVAKAHYRKAEITKTGVVKGKFSYMSPEQCQSQPLDRRSDVFSIGVLLYELTTLTKLFRAKSDYALLQQVVEARIPPPSLRVPGYPAELERIVLKALAKDPAARYPTAQALQLDLEEFARERKLAMSSVRIMNLMNALIERNDAKIRAGRARAEGLLDGEITPGRSGDAMAFLADGSAPSAPSVPGRHHSAVTPSHYSAVTPSHYSAMTPGAASVVTGAGTASAQLAPRSWRALWLVAAVIAGAAAAAVSIADRTIASAEERSLASALANDAEQLRSLFDSAAQSSHSRADTIVANPVLRAAMESDAATISDLAHNEMIFTPSKGQVLELYRFTGGAPTSLLRIPNTARALPALKGRETRIQSDGRDVTMIVSAPIAGYRGGLVSGVVMSTPVDLAPIRRALAEHATAASLSGLSNEIALLESSGGGGGASVKIPVPSSSDWTAGGNVTLTATPKRAAGLAWAGKARLMSGGLSALLLLGFLVSLARRPRA